MVSGPANKNILYPWASFARDAISMSSTSIELALFSDSFLFSRSNRQNSKTFRCVSNTCQFTFSQITGKDIEPPKQRFALDPSVYSSKDWWEPGPHEKRLIAPHTCVHITINFFLLFFLSVKNQVDLCREPPHWRIFLFSIVLEFLNKFKYSLRWVATSAVQLMCLAQADRMLKSFRFRVSSNPNERLIYVWPLWNSLTEESRGP